MVMQSINPATGLAQKSYAYWSAEELDAALRLNISAARQWRVTPLATRCQLLRRAVQILRQNREQYARVVSLEMGKLINEARAEVDKCASGCEFYADHAAQFLSEAHISTDATKSYITYQPLGTVLAIMPWNFPLWQVFRFAAPALVAGNAALLKHSSNVPQCGLIIEEVFLLAGFPEHLFRTLMIEVSKVADVIADARINAVTLTGSESAGRSVAAAAGKALKPSVLELGGSDAFIVLPDAPREATIKGATWGRFQNAGQSCIAAKRFILVGEAADWFIPAFKQAVEQLLPGDPLDESTTLAPLARPDLRDELHQQVSESIRLGAVAVTGCMPVPGPGSFYKASILDQVRPGMPAYDQELFGPVAAIIRARDSDEAVQIANSSRFGLGGSVWTQDTVQGERIALLLECGCAFVNGIVKSDPRLPFGGIKASGYGRELSVEGMREFVNIKTVWIK